LDPSGEKNVASIGFPYMSFIGTLIACLKSRLNRFEARLSFFTLVNELLVNSLDFKED